MQRIGLSREAVRQRGELRGDEFGMRQRLNVGALDRAQDHGAGLFQRIVGGDGTRVRRAIASKDGDRVVERGEEGVVIVLVHAAYDRKAAGWMLGLYPTFGVGVASRPLE